MDPFDPDWNLECAVEELSVRHRPGSLTSGKTRNELLRAWALAVGGERARRDFEAAVTRHGSRAALARAFVMAPATLREFEQFLHRLPTRFSLPLAIAPMRSAFAELSSGDQAAFVSVASQLLLDPDALHQLHHPRIRDQLSTALRRTVRVYDLRAAAEELGALLDGGEARESTYQRWCEEHPWAFGNALVLRDTTRRLDASSIVDVLLSDLTGFRHVVELKRPTASVLRTDRAHRTHYFSTAVSQAIGQVHKYLDRLQDTLDRAIPLHPELVAYHPRATIVIGRSKGWSSGKTRALQGLNARLHGVGVMTYDHLLAQARQMLEVLE